MIFEGGCFLLLKRFLPVVLLALPGSLLEASSIQTLSLDLGPLHAGSLLSGSVTLQNPLGLGDSVQIPLLFSDPQNYGSPGVTATLSVTNGVPADQFRFSPITFLNVANNRTYTLNVRGAATCIVDFPCQATGGFDANSPPAFSSTYTVTAAAAPVPEPGYGLLLSGLAGAVVLGRRLFRTCNPSA